MMETQLISTNNSQRFAKINKLIDLAYIAREQFEAELGENHDLAGYCGLASFRLLLMANYNGIYPTLAYGIHAIEPHAWIEYYNKIIDITATQFGYDDRVVVINKKNPFYRAEHKAICVSDVREVLYWCWDDIDDEFYELSKVKI